MAAQPILAPWPGICTRGQPPWPALCYNSPMRSYLERLAWGTDASFYRFIPEEVLMPETEAEVADIFARAHREGKSVTCRAAGTSLSGQATGDSLLMVCGKKWEKCEALDDGRRIRLQPGVVGGRVNSVLKPYGRRFTPDPASLGSAMVGGIVANNASGMCCGTHANSYRMLESVRLVLADGTILDTGDPSSRAAFAASHPGFLDRLAELRDRTRADAKLVERIRRKYSIKNVTGLTILPFVEYDDPFDILAHLIVGSEGTLAFLSEITVRTGPLPEVEESALLLFHTTKSACEAVSAMKPTGALSAAEFFDRKAMRAVEKDFPELLGLPEDAGAVLVKTESSSDAEAAKKRADIAAVLSGFKLATPAEFTADPALTGKWWAMRSGIFPAVGGTREIGATCLIEDVAVPVPRLAELTLELQSLFREHGYHDAVIYGHALEGNWHFILNQRFDTPEAVAQYDRMMRAVVELVAGKYGGSLKAEHGTGRNMAPFVRREWGDAAYRLMRDVKDLFDPKGILNPGVIFNEDPASYVRHLKPLPRVHEIVDRCIECGFCEVNCVACGFSLSSRQRIVVQREIARLDARGDRKSMRLAAELGRDFRKPGRDLCAGDGLCSMGCPLKINTGDFIHAIREREMPSVARRFGEFAARRLPLAADGVGALVDLAALGQAVLGNRLMYAVCRALHRGSCGLIPLWTPAMPHRVRRMPNPAHGTGRDKVVYFPSCINQRMGLAKGDPADSPLVNETTELLEKAGYEVVFPANMSSLCCGTIWESKGMPDVADRKAAELRDALRAASENGRWPVLCDQSPCLYRMRHTIRGLDLYEPFEFIAKFVLGRLDITPLDTCVAVHPTCSMRKMGLVPTILKVAKACAREVALPEEVGCCAFAGDKGFTDPKLNEWALRKLRGRIAETGATVGYSNSRTCEIGLTLHSGIPYMGIAHLVNKASRPRKGGE